MCRNATRLLAGFSIEQNPRQALTAGIGSTSQAVGRRSRRSTFRSPLQKPRCLGDGQGGKEPKNEYSRLRNHSQLQHEAHLRAMDNEGALIVVRRVIVAGLLVRHLGLDSALDSSVCGDDPRNLPE